MRCLTCGPLPVYHRTLKWFVCGEGMRRRPCCLSRKRRLCHTDASSSAAGDIERSDGLDGVPPEPECPLRTCEVSRHLSNFEATEPDSTTQDTQPKQAARSSTSDGLHTATSDAQKLSQLNDRNYTYIVYFNGLALDCILVGTCLSVLVVLQDVNLSITNTRSLY